MKKKQSWLTVMKVNKLPPGFIWHREGWAKFIWRNFARNGRRLRSHLSRRALHKAAIYLFSFPSGPSPLTSRGPHFVTSINPSDVVEREVILSLECLLSPSIPAVPPLTCGSTIILFFPLFTNGFGLGIE